MLIQPRRIPFHNQTGGITILVALMLLVLLTIAAVGMSRNSFREIVTSGFTRQGAMARSVADSGIEWSILWLYEGNGASATGTAAQLNSQRTALINDTTGTLSGKAKDIVSGGDYAPMGALQPDLQMVGPTGVVQGFTIGLTRMGKISATDTSVLPSQDYNAAGGKPTMNRPDLWAVRSDAQVQQGGVTFVHAKEAWISTDISSSFNK